MGENLFYGSSVTLETVLLMRYIFVSMNGMRRGNKILVTLALSVLQIVLSYYASVMGRWSIILSFSADALFISFCINGELRKKSFLLAVFYSFSIIFDSFAALIVSYADTIFKVNMIECSWEVMSTIISKTLLLLAVLGIGSTLRMDSVIEDWFKYLPAPLLVIAALLWGSPFTMDLSNSGIAGLLAVICVFTLLSNIFMIISMHRNSEKKQLEYRLEILEENKRSHKIHFMELREAYNRIERLAHDIKHHLHYIEAAPDTETVREYVHKLNERSFSQVRKYTGNFDVDVILNARINEIENGDIKISVNGILPVDIPWLDSVDVSIIIGNGLSNAIEACERCGGSNITVSFKYGDDWLVISVENPVADIPPSKGTGFGFTSAKAGEGHGIGMESMAASVERYDGTIVYETIEGRFRLDIQLQNRGIQ